MPEEKKKRRRPQKTYAGKPTIARRLAVYLDWVRTLEMDTGEEPVDLEPTYSDIFGPFGLLETGPGGFLDFRSEEICWLWKGSIVNGRPKMRVDGKLVYVHRWLFTRMYGPPPRGVVIVHWCDRTRCVRGSHLMMAPRNFPMMKVQPKPAKNAAKKSNE